MASYLDLSDGALVTLVARRDPDGLGELFRRYGAVVLVAAGWSEANALDAERRTVDVFLDVWRRPEAYVPGADSTRAHLVRGALQGATEEEARLAITRLAALEGWTYHDVAEALARPSHLVARVIRQQLGALLRDDG